MIRRLDPSDERVAGEVLALQQASYAVEAALVGFPNLPPLKETIHDLTKSDETFFGYAAGDQLVGVLSCKAKPGLLDIHRLMVHPDYFRRGVARSLMAHVEATEAVGRTAKRIVVSTASANLPARSLYLSLGFAESGEVERGLRITLYEKPPPGDGVLAPEER